MEETNPARVTRNMSTLAQHEEPRPALKKTASFADLTESSAAAGIQSTRDIPPLLGASPAAGGAAAAVRALELAQAAAEQTLRRSEPRLAAVERTLAVAG